MLKRIAFIALCLTLTACAPMPMHCAPTSSAA